MQGSLVFAMHNSAEHVAKMVERGEYGMTKVTMVFWKGEKFWLGRLLEYPEIMTQGVTIEELEENLKDAYRFLVLDDVPEEHQVKEISV